MDIILQTYFNNSLSRRVSVPGSSTTSTGPLARPSA